MGTTTYSDFKPKQSNNAYGLGKPIINLTLKFDFKGFAAGPY